VLTNKPQEITLRIVGTLWPGRPFRAVYGYQQDEYRKPHPRFAQRICEELGVRPADTWVIGDTPTDVETARRVGAVSIGVTWGFRERADLEAAGAARIVERPEDLG
jgi:phosphoglycolate phosphatase